MNIARIKQRLHFAKNNIRVWEPANVYPEAEIGRDVSIGMFSEVGPRVKIGDGVRVGAMCFIPEGVVIEESAWIGPRCTFTNDRYPPSPRSEWQITVVRKGARLGAGVTVVCGVVIGENALVGAGSVVTKNIPCGETWAGVPAERIK